MILLLHVTGVNVLGVHQLHARILFHIFFSVRSLSRRSLTHCSRRCRWWSKVTTGPSWTVTSSLPPWRPKSWASLLAKCESRESSFVGCGGCSLHILTSFTFTSFTFSSYEPPKDMERFTLLKSIHIFKKHRVQYEMRTHYRCIEVRSPSQAFFWTISAIMSNAHNVEEFFLLWHASWNCNEILFCVLCSNTNQIYFHKVHPNNWKHRMGAQSLYNQSIKSNHAQMFRSCLKLSTFWKVFGSQMMHPSKHCF